MIVIYRGIEFALNDTNAIGFEPVPNSDGTATLYNRWSIAFDIPVTPTTLSYRDGQGNAPIKTPARPARFPVQTITALESYLREPRGKLIVKDELGNVLLETPRAGNKTDALNGPVVEDCQIYEIHGVSLFRIKFRITAHVLPAVASSADSGIISNQWDVYLDVDQDRTAVRTTVGRVAFRTDEITRRRINADSLRRAFMAHRVPPKFQRVAVNVHAHSDGATIDYRVTDKQWHRSRGGNCIATTINAEEGSFVTQGSVFRATGQAGANQVAGAIGNLNQIVNGNPLTLPSRFFDWLAKFGDDVVQQHLAALPRYSKWVKVDLTGDPNVNREALMHAAVAVCIARIGGPSVFSPRMSEFTAWRSLSENRVSVQLTHSWSDDATLGFLAATGPIAALFFAGDVLAQPIGANQFMNSVARDPALRVNGGDSTLALDQNETQNPPFYLGGTRGTYFADLVTAVLRDFRELPPALG